jgi:hypothetical protein
MFIAVMYGAITGLLVIGIMDTLGTKSRNDSVSG